MEAEPAVEAGIAVAGPLTNVALMIVGGLLWRYDVFPADWLRWFVGVNALVAVVNLAPALPLDGGRLYRAYRSGVSDTAGPHWRRCGWASSSASDSSRPERCCCISASPA